MTYTPPRGKAYRIYNDLLMQTHLLVAGATGSGKSTVVNGIITNALYHTPADIGFILIDPKRVELREYIDLPHTMGYTSKIDDIPQTLHSVLAIVNARLADMERKHQRMYTGSNIYVIIDELMPIMVRSEIKKAVLPILQEILAIARCARVHVIACTQSPIVAVLPTQLKCNFDSRIALRTATPQDSRNILGSLPKEYPPCSTFPDPKADGKALAYYRHGADTDLYDVPRYTDAERAALINYWTTYGKRRA